MSTPALRPLGVLAVTAMAIVLGSHTTPVAHCALLACAGLVIALQPAEHAPHRRFCLVVLILGLLGLAAYLPASWFQVPPWRQSLANEWDLPLSKTVSPQPWVTGHQLVFFLGSLVWLAYLQGCTWSVGQRRGIIHGLIGILTALAALYITLWTLDSPWPRGERQDQFGPFANRNQTATLLAVNVALLTGLGLSMDRRHHWVRLTLSAAAIFLTLFALVLVGSRAAIALASIGAVSVYAITHYRHHRGRRKAKQALCKHASIAGSVSLLCLAALLTLNTRLSERLAATPATALKNFQEGRLEIYRDTWKLTVDQPLAGHGLGNFAAVFPFYREASISEYHVRHPESDWLWWMAELGWPVMMLPLAGLYVLWRHPPRLRRQHDERRYDHGLRIGVTVAMLIFLLHSLVDVPAHRTGTLWTALLLLGLLIPPSKRKSASWSRGLPLALAILGLFLNRQTPIDPVEQRPLAWQSYFQRAVTHLEKQGSTETALADFQRARLLEPHSALVPLAEGRIWLHYDPEFAVPAWHEALVRHPRRAEERFSEFLQHVKTNDELTWDMVQSLAANDPGRWISYLGACPPDHLTSVWSRLPQETDMLNRCSARERQHLIQTWIRRGDPATCLQFIETHPEWRPSVWMAEAEALAQLDRTREACEILAKHLLPTDIEPRPEDLDELRLSHARSPHAIPLLIQLIESTISTDQLREASLLTKKLKRQLGESQAEAHRLQFLLLCAQERWQEAWALWSSQPHGVLERIVSTSR